MSQQSLTSLKAMKLSGMAAALKEQLSQPNTYYNISFIEQIDMLVDRKRLYRENARMKRL